MPVIKMVLLRKEVVFCDIAWANIGRIKLKGGERRLSSAGLTKNW